MKKLNVMSLEEQQLNERQLSEVLGGAEVNWCDCWVDEFGNPDSVSVWHATPDPRPGIPNPPSVPPGNSEDMPYPGY